MILAAELPEQFVGPLKMLLGRRGIFLPVQVGDGIRGDTAQASSDRRGDRLVAVVLLHPGGGGIERRVLPVAEDDLTDDGEGQGVGTRPALDEPQDGIGGITEIVRPADHAGWSAVPVEAFR